MRKTRRIVDGEAAFTLIEIITVLVIIVIVLSIAVPVFNAMLGGTNLASAHNQISALLANARSDAVMNRQPTGLFFYIDSKTQQTAVAEVQVQTLYQINGMANPQMTPYFVPGTWAANNAWTASLYQNGQIESLELVNYSQPSGNPNARATYTFYRDVTILPKGVGVALNSQTFTYNLNNSWNWQGGSGTPNQHNAPLDRYRRIGCIMFDADGNLAQIPYGVPLNECMTQPTAGSQPTYTPNLLCQKIGMYDNDLASNYVPPATSSPTAIPLYSSPGLVLFDLDSYHTQHATMQVMDVSQSPSVQTSIGDGQAFNDWDLNYFVSSSDPVVTTPPSSAQQQDKFIEEAWIDKNGTAFMITPSGGSLIQAK